MVRKSSSQDQGKGLSRYEPLKMIASKDSMSILCAVSSYSLVIVLV